MVKRRDGGSGRRASVTHSLHVTGSEPVSNRAATAARLARACAIAWLEYPRLPATRPRRECRFPMEASVSSRGQDTPASDEVGASPTRSGGLSLLALDAEADKVGVHASSRARARASAGRWAVQRMRARPSTAQCADRVSTARAREGRGPARGADRTPRVRCPLRTSGRRHACALGISLKSAGRGPGRRRSPAPRRVPTPSRSVVRTLRGAASCNSFGDRRLRPLTFLGRPCRDAWHGDSICHDLRSGAQ